MMTVNVLLSTYNGAAYLREQLDSLLAQTYPDVLVHIRDDGSTDSTLSILDDYAARYETIKLFRGENLGAAKSFFRLLQTANDHADYFAFCDQDDVWQTDKLARAVSHLSNANDSMPTLYFSSFELVDDELHHLGFPPPFRSIGFRNALVQNAATGCTQVMNRAARRLLISRPPEFFFLHDWWVYTVICACGQLIYDDTPTLKYRQHDANVLGHPVTSSGRFRNKFIRFFSRKLPILSAFRQANELYRLYAEILPPPHLKTLEAFVHSKENFSRRLGYALFGNTVRRSPIDTLVFKVMVLFNHY